MPVRPSSIIFLNIVIIHICQRVRKTCSPALVYQGILRRGEAKGLAKGEARGIREALLIHGRKKLGPPDEKTSARIAEIHDLDRLKLLLERILDVSSWHELLAPDDASA